MQTNTMLEKYLRDYRKQQQTAQVQLDSIRWGYERDEERAIELYASHSANLQNTHRRIEDNLKGSITSRINDIEQHIRAYPDRKKEHAALREEQRILRTKLKHVAVWADVVIDCGV